MKIDLFLWSKKLKIRKVKRKLIKSLLNKRSSWFLGYQDHQVRCQKKLYSKIMLIINMNHLQKFLHLVIQSLSLTINYLKDCKQKQISITNHHILFQNLHENIIKLSQRRNERSLDTSIDLEYQLFLYLIYRLQISKRLKDDSNRSLKF